MPNELRKGSRQMPLTPRKMALFAALYGGAVLALASMYLF